MQLNISPSWRSFLLLLLLVDTLALTIAFFLAYWLRIESNIFHYGSEVYPDAYISLCIYSLPLLWIVFCSCRLYDPHDLFYGTMEYVQVVKGITYVVVGIIVMSFVMRAAPSRGWLVFFWILAVLLVNLGRFGFRRAMRRLLKNGLELDRALIVGASEEARAIAERLMNTGRMEVVGFLDEFSPVGEEVTKGIKVKGAPQDCDRIIREERITQLILVPDAVSWETHRELLGASMKGNGVTIHLAPGFNELYAASLRVSYVGYIPLLYFRPGYVGGLEKILKGALDWTLGLALFVISLPVTLIVSLWILLREGRPVWEASEVVGRYGRPFFTYKFRTGKNSTARRCFFNPNGDRGRLLQERNSKLKNFLIRSGLDKLPQLTNVLRGQMSLVGPRTFPVENVSQYGIWLPGLVAVKPGMTGPWAIQDVQYLHQEISLTLSYIHTWTLWKDLQILMLTALFLVQRRLNVREVRELRNDGH